jgi:hypothetical protein
MKTNDQVAIIAKAILEAADNYDLNITYMELAHSEGSVTVKVAGI